MIEHGVVERVRQLVPCVHPVHHWVGVVNGVGVTAVGVDAQGAVGAHQQEAAAAIGRSGHAGALLAPGANPGDAALGRQGRVVAIDVTVVGEHIAAGVGARCAVVGAARLGGDRTVVAGDRGIIGALDGDAQHAEVGEADGVVENRVIEGFLQAVAGAEGINGWVAVVDDVGVGAVGIHGEGAVGPLDHEVSKAIGDPSHTRPFAAPCAHGGHGSVERWGVVAIHVGVVGQHIAAGIAAGRAVGHAARFHGGGRIVVGDGGIVGAMDGDGQNGRIREPAAVTHRVVEVLAHGVEGIERLNRGVVVVNHVGEGPIGMDGQGAIEPLEGCTDGARQARAFPVP